MTETPSTPSLHDSNRRRFLRVVPEPLIPVRVDITGVDFFDICKAFDISEGGVRIVVPHRFEGFQIDGPIDFTVHLPDPVNRPIQARGQVRHIASNSFGVRFTSIDEASRALVRRYIASWLRRNEGLFASLRYTLGRKS